MGTNYIAPTWRMPENTNKDKLSNYSIEFDGSSTTSINVGNISAIQGSSTFSISAWINIDSGGASRIFGSWDHPTNSRIVGFGIHSDDKLLLQISSNGVSFEQRFSSSTVPTNTWVHVAVTFSSGNISFYIDGNEETALSNISSPYNISSDYFIASFKTSSNFPLEGKISQLTVFDSALTDEQINYLYELNNPMIAGSVNLPTPVAYWPLGDNSNPIATAGYPNIPVGADSVFDFNGANGVIPLPQGSLQLVTSISISAWIKTTLTGTRQTIISNDNVSSGDNNGGRSWNFLVNGQNIDFTLRPENDPVAAGTTLSNITTSGVNIADDNWHNVVALWDGTTNANSQKVFVDGILRAQGTPSFTQPIRQYAPNKPTIGDQAGQTAFWDFEGKMSNIQIWEAGLTYGAVSSLGDTAEGEVAQLYNNGQPLMTGTQPQAANLKAWYKLNQSANWEADSALNWQIPDALSAYPQSMEITGHSIGGKIKVSDFFSDGTTALNGFNFTPAAPNTAGDKYAVCTISWWQKLNYNPAISGTFAGVFDFASQYNTLQVNYSHPNKALMYLTLFNVSRYWQIAGTGSTVDVSDQKWHHYCLLIPDAATNATARLFIDNNDLTGTGGGTHSMGYPMELMQIGTSQRVTNSNFSNVQVFNSILSDSQVETLYNNGVPLTTVIASSNLKAWYKLDDTSNYINSPQNLTFTPDYWSIDPSNTTPGATEALNFSGGYQNTSSVYEGIDFNDTPLTDNKFIMSCWYNSTKSSNDNSYIYHNYSGGTIAMQFSSDQVNVYANPATVGSHMVRYYLPGTRTGWHHLVIYMNQGSGSTVNLDNTDNLKLYVDGSEISVGLVLGDVSAAPVRTEANRLGMTTGGNFEGFQWSNWALLVGDNAVLSAIPTLYNGGTPGDISSLNPTWWYKLNSSDVSFPTSTPPTNAENVFTVTDSSGNGNTTTGPFYFAKNPSYERPSIQTVNVVSNQGISSGMTESNLVNNNVSTLNGESSGMNTTNLVQSNLTRKQPFSSYSIYFDSPSNSIIPLGTAPNIPSTLTISAWFNKSSVVAGGFPSYAGIFGTRNQSTLDFPYMLSGEGNNSTKLRFRICQSDSISKEVISSGTQDSGVWYHIAGVADGSNITLYINGVAETPVSYNGTIITPTDELVIGAQGTSGALAGFDFDGLISNCALWDSALNQNDILNIYNNGVSQDLTNFRITPTRWYPMDQSHTYFNGSVLVARDVINGNDGTGVNLVQENIIGNAPGSQCNGTGSNLTIADLKGDMKSSINNSHSINMADYADGVTNPANSGRSTNVP